MALPPRSIPPSVLLNDERQQLLPVTQYQFAEHANTANTALSSALADLATLATVATFANTAALATQANNASTANVATLAVIATFANTAAFANTANVANTANSANDSSNLNGHPGSFYTNASNISTGTLDIARLPAQAYIPVHALGGKKWSTQSVSAQGSLHGLQAGIVSPGTSGSAVVVTDSGYIGGRAGSWHRFTPQNNNGNECGWEIGASSANGIGMWEGQPRMAALVRTGPSLSDYSPAKKHLTIAGFSGNNQTFTAGNTTATQPHVAIFGVPSGTTTGNWEVSTGNGSVQNVSSVGFMTMAPNTIYILTVEYVSNTSAKCTVQDVTNGVSNSVTVTVDHLVSTQMSGKGLHALIWGSAPIQDGSATFLDIGSLYAEIY
jgi:hypothetical protein